MKTVILTIITMFALVGCGYQANQPEPAPTPPAANDGRTPWRSIKVEVSEQETAVWNIDYKTPFSTSRWKKVGDVLPLHPAIRRASQFVWSNDQVEYIVGLPANFTTATEYVMTIGASGKLELVLVQIVYTGGAE